MFVKSCEMGPSSHGKVSFAQVADKLLWVLVVKRLRSEVKWPSGLVWQSLSAAQQSGLMKALLPVLSSGPRVHPAHTFPELATAHTSTPCPEAALHGIRSPVRKSGFLPIAERGKLFA